MKNDSSEQILTLLKKRGKATSKSIADELYITKEGARKHLLNLLAGNYVKSSIEIMGVGRPSTFYSLTDKGLSRFPDSHADISVQLLRSVKNLLGENALDLLINDRGKIIYDRYSKEISEAGTLEEKLEALCKKRSEEGYMAEWRKENNIFYLIENHCPICAAATECQKFCHSESQNFKKLFGNEYIIERVEHIVGNENRCVYKIIPNNQRKGSGKH